MNRHYDTALVAGCSGFGIRNWHSKTKRLSDFISFNYIMMCLYLALGAGEEDEGSSYRQLHFVAEVLNTEAGLTDSQLYKSYRNYLSHQEVSKLVSDCCNCLSSWGVRVRSYCCTHTLTHPNTPKHTHTNSHTLTHIHTHTQSRWTLCCADDQCFMKSTCDILILHKKIIFQKLTH
jgi:hypothetical protein